jgi:hypothetical protein
VEAKLSLEQNKNKKRKRGNLKLHLSKMRFLLEVWKAYKSSKISK